MLSTIASPLSCCNLLHTSNFSTVRVDSKHGAFTPAISKTKIYRKATKLHGRQTVDCAANTSSTRPFEIRNGTQLAGLQFVAMAASMAILLSSDPAQAGLLSGSLGLESIPGPELPQFDFLKRKREENQKKYEADDAKFKSSPLLQELLKRSKDNAARNKEEIQNKYCERGAEWGVGDCSTIGMSKDEREAFMEMLRQKRANK
ncbi:hypothetical protein SUGI_1016110 [Cryptomeria japonica]|nr:hypothetical protein SUGI_1016110 [Cryptomeria japonica]